MNREIARALIESELASLQGGGYAALRSRVGEHVVKDVVGPDGQSYQVEILIVWDVAEDGAIRLLGAIDDGGLATFVRPLSADALIDPDEN
jgi:hypothetical protein